jgi:hypothetical protein
MKKIVLIAILMATVTFVQGQRRYGEFNIGGMNPVELSEQIEQQINTLQKDLKKLDRKLLRQNTRSKREPDLTTNQLLNESIERRIFLISEIEKLIEQKNAMLVSNKPTTSVKVNTKNPMNMATAYYMIKVADGYSATTKTPGFTGILVNYWNYRVDVVVTDPAGITREFSLAAGSSVNPSVQEFEFQIPGNYTATFKAVNNQAKSVTKPGGMPTAQYSHNGKLYDFKATQLGRF